MAQRVTPEPNKWSFCSKKESVLVALNPGRVVANNVSGNYTPDFGLLGAVNGLFVLNVTGDVEIQAPANAFNGAVWWLVINNTSGHDISFASDFVFYAGYEHLVIGITTWQIIREANKNYLMVSEVF